MVKLHEIYDLCEGFEKVNRADAVKKLMSKGYSFYAATKYYNIWRRHYMESSREDLMLSGICIQTGTEKKFLEECSYEERQKCLEALSKEQLVKITQAMLK